MPTSTSPSRYGFAALVLLALSNGANGFVASSQHPNAHYTSAFATTLPSKSLEYRPSHRAVDTALHYATVVEPPMPPAVRRGLEDLATGGETRVSTVEKKTAPSWRAQRNEVVTVHTLEEFRREVGKEHGRIVVVRFFATWCKACKAVAPSFYKLARTYPNVKIVEVPVTPKNSNLHQGLGVPTVPFGHIYHPEAGLVEELKLTRTEFSVFQKVLDSYVEGFCDLSEDGDCLDPHPRLEVVTKADKIAI